MDIADEEADRLVKSLRPLASLRRDCPNFRVCVRDRGCLVGVEKDCSLFGNL